MSTPRWLVGSACLAVALGGCDLFRDNQVDPIVPASPDAAIVVADASGIDAGNGPDGFPLPRTDLVKRIGSADTLDIATWNVRYLGTTGIKNSQKATDLALVADIIASLDLDIVAVEEIASETAWAELAKRLPEHEAVLSTHTYGDGTYQKVGFLYRKTASVVSVDRLFNALPFARPPLRVLFRYDDGVHAEVTFAAIGVHLEAGTMDSDKQRRVDSGIALDGYVATQLGIPEAEHDIMILGDFNSQLSDTVGSSLEGLRANATRYAFRTAAAASAGESSHASRRFIDHVVTTAGFGGAAEAHAVRVDQDPDVRGFDAYVGDHYPVVISIPLAPR